MVVFAVHPTNDRQHDTRWSGSTDKLTPWKGAHYFQGKTESGKGEAAHLRPPSETPTCLNPWQLNHNS